MNNNDLFTIIPSIIDPKHGLYKYYNGIYITYRYIKLNYAYKNIHYVYADDANSFEYKFINKLIKDLKPRKVNDYNVITGVSNLLILNSNSNQVNLHVLNMSTTETEMVQELSSKIFNEEIVFIFDYKNGMRFNPYDIIEPRMDGYINNPYAHLFKYRKKYADETIDKIHKHIYPKLFIKNLNTFLDEMNDIDETIMTDGLMVEFKKLERALKLESLNIL